MPEQVVANGYGATRPIVKPASDIKNRRAEIVVLSTEDNSDSTDYSGELVTKITIGKITEDMPLGSDYYSSPYPRIILPESVMQSIALQYLPDLSTYAKPTSYIVAVDDQQLET